MSETSDARGPAADSGRREGGESSVAKTVEDTAPAGGESAPSGRPPPAGPSSKRLTAPRRTRVVVRKVGPWSILKFSLIFYFCVMLVILFAVYILYSILSTLGTLDSLIKLLVDFSLVNKEFQLDTGFIFTRLFVFGVVLVILWSIVNVFATFLYNLISDLVGGIEITLAEKR